MSNDSGSNSVLWTALAAIGGVLSGVAAILALFIAKPDTVNILIPQQTLEQAGLLVDAPLVASRENESVATPAPAMVDTTTVESAAAIVTPPPSAPARTIAPGLSAALISVSEQRERYVATFRFENSTAANVGVAVQGAGAFEADFLLTDGVGGSCRMISNGEGWGSLNAEEVNPYFTTSGNGFRAIPAGSSAQHTIFFNKGRCDTPIRRDALLSLTGSFVLADGHDDRRAGAVSFENIQITR